MKQLFPKQYLSLIFLLLIGGTSFSQTFYNEWVNYSQQYYKIPVFKDGVYRLDSAQLASAGVPIGSIDPRTIQLFHKGQELYIYINGESDGVLNANDYILYYAENNTGKDDSTLYYFGNYICNPYKSVINDTAAVFFTWNTSTSNRRLFQETDISFSGYSPAPFFIKEDVQALNYQYFYGPENGLGITDPRYSFGEGWVGPDLELGQSSTFAFNTSTLYQGSGVNLHASIAHAGKSNPYYAPDHDVKLEYQNASSSWVTLSSYSYDGYQVFKEDFNIDPTQVGSNFSLKLNNVNNSAYDPYATTMAIYYARITYPSTFNMLSVNEQKLVLPDATSGTKSYVSVSNFNAGSAVPMFFDLSNHKIITMAPDASGYGCLVPNSGSNKKCFITSQSAIENAYSIKAVNGTGMFVDYMSLATDSAFVIITNAKLSSSAAQYASYRQSFAGGSHNVITAFVNDLYDQFSYGVNRHSLSIKHFCKYLLANYPSPPQNLLLLGKSVHAYECVGNPSVAALSLVPSFGYPSSDNLFSNGLGTPGALEVAIPIGRVSATDDATVTAYLNKIILHESQSPGQEWQKNVLHFVGGANSYEQSIFNGYMEQNKQTIEDTLYGGNVYTFKKTSTAPIAINTNDSIKNVIESGVSLITFFGHGSTTGFEQNIDDPYTFANSPRFPLLVANSCYTGDIHTKNVVSASEKFVLADDHGTIGFIATVSSGVSYALQYYTDEFYKNISYKKYGRSFGESMKNTVRNMETLPSTSSDSILRITCIEMSLEGDPSLRLNVSPKPDYVLTNPDVLIDTDSQVDSINVNIHFYNYGKDIADTIKVIVRRTFPDGSDTSFFKTILAPAYETMLDFNIPKSLDIGVGLNKFYVKVDYYNDVLETNEGNNETIGEITAFVRGGDIVPVYPYQYAIVPDISKVILKASTADPFAPVYTYRIQVDTSDAFNNPLVNTTINAPGGVVELPVTLNNVDSMVYFWRVGKDSSDLSAISWRESSFQTITGKSGWGQAHFHQFKNDIYQFVSYNKPIRKFEFKNNLNTVFCRTGLVGQPSPPYLYFADNSYYFNNAQQNYWTCGGGVGWSFAVFDSISGQPIRADSTNNLGNGTWLTQYNSCSCVPQLRNVFDFGLYNGCNDNNGSMNVYMQRMQDFLNAVPAGDYVLAYSHDNDSSEVFSSTLLQAFQLIGTDSVRYKTDTNQMIIFGKKLNTAYTGAHITIGQNKWDIISQTDTFSSKWNNGYIISELIGPAIKWKSLHWRYQSLDNPDNDSIYIKVLGIKLDGTVDTITEFIKDSTDVYDLQNYVDVNTYPYIKLMAPEADYVNYTAPQLKRWQVIYDEVPEAAINPPLGYTINSTKLKEGEDLVIKLPIQNISDQPFTDSLLITYWVVDSKGVSHQLPDVLKPNPFLPDSVIFDTIKVNTLGYAGSNALWIDVNTLNHPKYQLEQTHFNNVAQVLFNVDGDKINPLLDVTFDGVHILNGDIVSAKPQILISLKDENKFLALNDTTDFTVKLTYPNSGTETNLYFSKDLYFTPAQLPNNSCKIEFNPSKLDDGKYLLSVQAKDRSNNVSGDNEYKIQFEVINKSTITEILNYPNPFSTSTRFVFTLTGSQIPETFKIQIMTITGKVVREISREEIGDIKIGRNITEFAWNGKDEFGDQLANGVYLYRVITRINGEEIEKRETAADEYFKKGWGKLVIMR